MCADDIITNKWRTYKFFISTDGVYTVSWMTQSNDDGHLGISSFYLPTCSIFVPMNLNYQIDY